MKKFLILLIVSLAVVLSVSVVAAGGLLGGDDVTVKNVEIDKLYKNMSDKSDYYNGYNIDFAFVPNVDFTHVRSIRLDNVELTFGDNVEKFGDASIQYEINEDNNADLKYHEMFLKDNYYSFTVKLADVKFNDYNSLKHMKADIVINTTTQDNIVIGHIDNDININTAKIIDVGGRNNEHTAKYNF